MPTSIVGQREAAGTIATRFIASAWRRLMSVANRMAKLGILGTRLVSVSAMLYVRFALALRRAATSDGVIVWRLSRCTSS